MEMVLKVEHGIPRPFSKCIGASTDAGTHRQAIITQLHLKEVGSVKRGRSNARHQSRCACVPPFHSFSTMGVNQ